MVAALLLWGAGGVTAQAQSSMGRNLASPAVSEQGRPFLRTVASQTYGAHPQNFDVLVGPRGHLYAANARGVLVYDGEQWQLVDMPNRTAARSLAQGPDGTIYVGGQDDVGRLVREADGTLRVESLRPHLPKSHRTLSSVWRTHAANDAVYFGTEQALYRWRNGAMHVWEGPFYLTLEARGTIYVQSTNGDVQRVEGNRLVPVPGLEALPTVYTAVPLGDDLLISTFARGMLRVSDGTVTPWRPEAADALVKARVYNAQSLPNGGVALGTQAGGVFVYGPDGRLRRHVDRSTGLNSDYVYGLTLDRDGGLWLAQTRGLARVETHRPLVRYGAPEGLEGNVLSAARMEGTLYVGTMQGLYALRPADAPGRPAQFDRVSDAPVVHDLLVHNEALLAATSQGLLRVTATDARPLTVLPGERAVAAALVADPERPDRVFVGRTPGVSVIERINGQWRHERTIDVPGRVSHLALGSDRSLWTGSESGPVYRISRAAALGDAPDSSVARYDTTDGLPSMRFNIPYRVEDRIVAGTTDGPYRFDASTGTFAPDVRLRDPLPEPDRYVSALVPDAEGRVWMHVGETTDPVTGALRPQSDDTYRWETGVLRRLVGFTTYVIYRDGAATWIGGPGLGPDNLLVRAASGTASTRLGPASLQVSDDRAGPSPVIRQLTLVGADSTAALVPSNRRADVPVLDASLNSVRLTYAAPAFDRPDKTTYRVRLRRDGSTTAWSPWRSTTEATFTTLDPGRYVFEVQARDVYGDVGPPATATFTVLPPWYRTWWAYALYTLGVVGLVVGLVHLRTRRLRARQRELEATVAARTEEVRHQKDQLEHQADELRALDEAKSRFFANLSHEFRTPLTLILGPVRRLRRRLTQNGAEALHGDDLPEQLGVVERNAHRLLRMVQQILNLARHDAGTLDLEARPTPLADEVRRIAQAFVPLAERQQLTLTIDADPAPETADPVYCDAEYLEQILGNLLGNAIKFTPAGGTVAVRVVHDATTARLTVRDTGPGIPPEEQARIFDRFTQADDAAARAKEGAGIGLALASTLVDLHGGTLTVDSTEGDGATFTVAFPRGRDHLTDDQVDPGADAASPPDADRDTVASPRLPAGDAPLSAATTGTDPTLPADPSTGDTPTSPLILVVDDNADVRSYVRSVLEPAFRVAEAGTGAEGLTAAREHLPDLILADVMMPEMDGLTMTERLRADDRTAALPIVMLTARAGTEDEVEGLSAGATDYVVKPFDPEVLEMRVRGTLAYQERLRRRLLDEIDDADAPNEPAPDDLAPFEREMRSLAAQHLPDPDFGVSDLADALAVSRSTLYRRAREADAPSPAELLRTMRLTRGAELLRDGAGTVSEVAYAVGYNSLSHFSTQFADHFGQPPTAYVADDA